MLDHIADSLPMFGVSFFETSDSFINALKLVASVEIALISLDNDLEPVVRDGQLVDAGDGVEVARFLVESQASKSSAGNSRPPVVIHTTNEPAAIRMQGLFSSVDWLHDRVIPFDAERWIGEIWIQKVRALIIANVTDRRIAPVVR